ncbi:hypothetical protein L596_016576 [Steinernema carpocapsae]|uniref:Major sperm protein n=1 Tax=Steinernema carpocapsae TaxID=34508 RepID=A0A4V6A3E7_STECR|nr:hypothetical protein L596_016576 [Steinernema carpocapsae]
MVKSIPTPGSALPPGPQTPTIKPATPTIYSAIPTAVPANPAKTMNPAVTQVGGLQVTQMPVQPTLPGNAPTAYKTAAPGTPPPMTPVPQAKGAVPVVGQVSPVASGPPGARNLGENKPGEPPFQMQLVPDTKISFRSNNLCAAPIVVEVKIINTTPHRQTFKVRCTSNEIFRVEPPMGFINKNEAITLKIMFHSATMPEPNRHFFAIQHMRMKPDELLKPIAQLWKRPDAKLDGVKRLIASFEKEDGTVYGG